MPPGPLVMMITATAFYYPLAVRPEEMPKMVAPILGIGLLLSGISYLLRYERNAKGARITLVVSVLVLAYFFLILH